MGMYAKLTITIGPPGDEVKLVHMRPIETLNDIQKFPAEIRAFSMDFLDLENINPLRLAEKKQPLADRVKFLDD